jgi:hypothetical protein
MSQSFDAVLMTTPSQIRKRLDAYLLNNAPAPLFHTQHSYVHQPSQSTSKCLPTPSYSDSSHSSIQEGILSVIYNTISGQRLMHNHLNLATGWM